MPGPKLTILAAVIMAGIAAPATATTRTVCALFEDSSFDNQCGNMCGWITSIAEKKYGLSRSWRPGSKIWKPVPPAAILPPGPKTVTSCDVVSKEPPKGHCVATVCGPADVTLRDGERPFGSETVAPAKLVTAPCGGPNNPCRPLKPSAVGTPGLLESDSGFAAQGPAAAGTATPGRAATGSTATGIPGRH
jgi:hypothetical protein